MATRYNRTIVIWKGVRKNSLTCYSFYLIESRISSNCTRNIQYYPSQCLLIKKKIHKTKFEIEEENTKLKIAGRSAFVNPIFFDF